MDNTVQVWDNHLIRPSRNERVYHGRPNVMYIIPELYNSRDYLQRTSPNDRLLCAAGCTFRSSIVCDDDVFRLCCSLMAVQNLNVPKDAYEAVDLYMDLRRLLITLLE